MEYPMVLQQDQMLFNIWIPSNVVQLYLIDMGLSIYSHGGTNNNNGVCLWTGFYPIDINGWIKWGTPMEMETTNFFQGCEKT